MIYDNWYIIYHILYMIYHIWYIISSSSLSSPADRMFGAYLSSWRAFMPCLHAMPWCELFGASPYFFNTWYMLFNKWHFFTHLKIHKSTVRSCWLLNLSDSCFFYFVGFFLLSWWHISKLRHGLRSSNAIILTRGLSQSRDITQQIEDPVGIKRWALNCA